MRSVNRLLLSLLLCGIAPLAAQARQSTEQRAPQTQAGQDSARPQDSGATNPGGLGNTATPTLEQAQDAIQSRVVPLRDEPHHVLIMQNDFARIYAVSVPPNDTTLMHRHDRPYLAINFGAAAIENDVQGKPAVNLQLADGQVIYSLGGFAHVAKTSGAAFRNVTVELIKPQGTAKNLCKEIVVGPLACLQTEEASKQSATQTADVRKRISPGSARKRDLADAAKSSAHTLNTQKKPSSESADDDLPYFETDQVRADMITVSSGRDYVDESPKSSALLVAMTNSNIDVNLSGQHVSFFHTGDTLWMPAGTDRRVTDFLGTRSNFLLVTFKDANGGAIPQQ
jgi:hypothetical protein